MLFSTVPQEYEESDVVIVGGGPAGLALASALGSYEAVRYSSLRVTLVEASDLSKVSGWTPTSDAFSNRVSSITKASVRFLSDIGAWKHVEEERTCPIEHMEVWDGISDARITFNAADLLPGTFPSASELTPTQPSMARLTENLNLQRALLRSFSSSHSNSITVLDKTKVQSISKDAEHSWPVVRLSTGQTLRARLLVGADGHNSPVRAFSSIGSYGWAYDRHAIVATLRHAPHARGTAFQRFLPTGPIAFLPLTDRVSSLVWSTTPPLARALLGAEEGVLPLMVNAAFRLPHVSMQYLHSVLLDSVGSITVDTITNELAFRERAHAIPSHSAYSSLSSHPSSGIPPADAHLLPPRVHAIQPGTAASFPLRCAHADAYTAERVALVGDAAHTVHPLAGQGLNMGLGDAEALARCISDALSVGGDIGSITALQPYPRARYFANHKLLSAVDKLHKLYSTTAPPVVWARSTGVEVLNELDSVKAAVMLNAGGSEEGAGSRGGRRCWVESGCKGV